MDWNAAIERNGEALKRILAVLVAMAELGCRGQFAFFPQKGAVPQGAALAERSKPSPVLTLPRHLHRAVLRLLRPAESAARRLVIVAARGLTVELPPARPRRPKPKPAILRNGVGTGIVMPRNLPSQPGPRLPARRTLALPLTDPLPRWRRSRPAAGGVPRISFPGFRAPSPIPVRLPLSPDDPIDAARLALRLQALASALDDLPRHARRFARWQARNAAGAQSPEKRNAGRFRRCWPLRPGRPPGHRPAGSRRPAHEIHEVLGNLQYFAFHALERLDTS